MICPTCRQKVSDPIGIDAIQSLGECLACDHVRGEREEMIRDMQDEFETDDPDE